jgi:hypothetical protein
MGLTDTSVFDVANSVTMKICCWNMNWLIWSLLQVQNQYRRKMPIWLHKASQPHVASPHQCCFMITLLSVLLLVCKLHKFYFSVWISVNFLLVCVIKEQSGIRQQHYKAVSVHYGAWWYLCSPANPFNNSCTILHSRVTDTGAGSFPIWYAESLTS